MAHWKAFDKRAVKNETKLISKLKEFFKQQKAYIVNEIKKTLKLHNGRYIVTKVSWGRFADVLSEDEYHAMWDRILEDAMRPLLLATIRSEAGYTYNLSTGLSFDLNNDAAERLVGAHLRHVHDINQTTRNELYVELQTGFREGESINDLANRILDVFDEADSYRAEMIARTETISASNGGAMEGYREAGVAMKRWIATPDDRTRDSHADMIGSDPIPIDDPFIVGGEEMMQPGDDSLGASAGNIINCRCAIAGIIEGID